jgi:hypothetical protein
MSDVPPQPGFQKGEILQGKVGTRREACLCVVYRDTAEGEELRIYRPFWTGRQTLEKADPDDFIRLFAKVRLLYVEGLLELEDTVEEFETADDFTPMPGEIPSPDDGESVAADHD